MEQLNTTTYYSLGWDAFFGELPESDSGVAARVITENRGHFVVVNPSGELAAVLPRSLRKNPDQRPAVGDWVIIDFEGCSGVPTINRVLPRRSKLSRKVTGRQTREQVVAANLDTVFIVSGLDGGRNLNLRRIERYLVFTWNSGASPVILLNKADLHEDNSGFVGEVEAIAGGVPVRAVSASDGTGLDFVRGFLGVGRTVGFVGSSGVGKSALTNALLGRDTQLTGDVRQGDLTGRHTTTRRQLLLIPDGGMIIDTPGMRELQLWAKDEDLDDAFSDITAKSGQCRFLDCSHTVEPDCAVREAVASGTIEAGRLESYLKLNREIEHLVRRETYLGQQEEKARWKNIGKMVKDLKKTNRKHGGTF
ncbi:MAG: ribosome small subunit-dependent GTPase A [Dehalogenimonas sp.]